MSVRREIPEYDGLYFITFTCCHWQKLFEITNGYGIVYNWFDHLKSKGHFINGYVIMPNHVHALIAQPLLVLRVCMEGRFTNKRDEIE